MEQSPENNEGFYVEGFTICSRLYFKSMRENWIIQYKQNKDNCLPIIYQRFIDLNGKNETIKLLKKNRDVPGG